MKINEIARPWMRANKNRNSDPWYRTQEWKQTRQAFLNSKPHVSLPPIGNVQYKNTYCIDCWQLGRITPTHTVDHVQAIRDGGAKLDFKNMAGRCESHNAAKTARDGNNRRNNKRN